MQDFETAAFSSYSGSKPWTLLRYGDDAFVIRLFSRKERNRLFSSTSTRLTLSSSSPQKGVRTGNWPSWTWKY